MMAWNAVDGLFSNTSGGSGVWGGGSNWTTLSGENGQNQNLAESVGVFAGKKGTVTVKETQPFDTLQFKTDGYVLDEGQLAIAPAEGNTGVLNVDSKVTASIRSIITGEGKNLEKTGAGELELFAENQYTGDTFINGGTLAVNSDSSFGSPDGSIIINGGILKTGVGFKSKRAITLGEHDGGIESSSGTELVISGQVTGSGTLFKYGPGTLELTNPGNDYQGGTTIDQGLFRLTDSGAAGFGDIFLNSGAGIEMRLDGNSSMGNQIDGYGTIEKS